MWILRNDAKGLIYRVTPEKHIIVSRKDGDLLLLGDQSISRKHAQLFVQKENENEGVVVTDLGSKYGTFTTIGGGESVQLVPNQPVTLKNKDCVKFGIQFNTWCVEFMPLMVATSTLTPEEKTEVKQIVGGLGGQVLDDWQDQCTHLTMNKITVTVKVVCALASGRPIVTPAYWIRLTQTLSDMKSPLPDCNDFVPPLVEAMLDPSDVSFACNPARSKLFSGYTFVTATSRQLKRIKNMVTAAGGTVIEFSANTWSEKKLIGGKTILMQNNDKQGSQHSQIPEGYILVARKLRAQGVRCIPEPEIGLSVLYCSMARYCNPHFSPQTLLGASPQEATQPVTISSVDTEESTSPRQNVDGTSAGPSGLPVSKKRTREIMSDDEELNTSKKISIKGVSLDLFGTQQLNNTKEFKNMNKKSLTLKKPTSQNQSLSVSKENFSIIKPGPSLDMFAPSGVIKPPSAHDLNEALPSGQDLFGSGSSTKPQERKIDDNDEFSFLRNKISKPEEKIENGDAFAFTSKKLKKVQVMTMEGDEFSFHSDKKSKKRKEMLEDGDEFSFTSFKKSKIRSDQSDSDLFASNAESSFNHSVAGPSKVPKIEEEEDVFGFKTNKEDPSEDNVFTFLDEPKSKRRRKEDKNSDSVKSEYEVVISKEDNAFPGSSGLQNYKEPEVEAPVEMKKLITYSKLNPSPGKIKQEVVDDEIDKFTKELVNATIVVVKPLVVQKSKPVESTTVRSEKNFKKFRKVVGLNKRIVPHIIGGSDLVPYVRANDQLPLSPEPLTPRPVLQDDWGF